MGGRLGDQASAGWDVSIAASSNFVVNGARPPTDFDSGAMTLPRRVLFEIFSGPF
jgi:hypothetical protein